MKAGVRGVYAAITGCSEKEALLADNALVRLTVESQIEVVETSYGPLNIVGCKRGRDTDQLAYHRGLVIGWLGGVIL